MTKMSKTSYRALFLKHVFRFLGNVSTPAELAGFHMIAVSGGLDSMTLLWLGHTLFSLEKIGPIRVVFVHHHTRPGQDYDADFIKEYCEARDIPFEILHAEGLDDEAGNFEQRARTVRRNLLNANLKKNELLWMGHHVDDSYEWSIMQRYRSSQPKSSLGIPVRNGRIIRPFLCVSKSQLRTMSRQEGITFREDPTNKLTRYDRNFLRGEIIPLIKARYPQYLKHYVNHANYMAMILHLNITNRVDGNKIHVYEHGAIIEGSHFSQFQVQELLQSFSHAERGEITSQIMKMLKAIDNGKKGPFQFSGGTEIYFTPRLLMIYQRKMKNHDQIISKVLKGISESEFDSLPDFTIKDLERAWDNLTRSSDAMMNMPGLVCLKDQGSICKTLNASVYDSLFPETSKVIKEKGYCFVPTLKCLETWKRKKNKLPEKIRLLPLWTLSNLFPSQE